MVEVLALVWFTLLQMSGRLHRRWLGFCLRIQHPGVSHFCSNMKETQSYAIYTEGKEYFTAHFR